MNLKGRKMMRNSFCRTRPPRIPYRPMIPRGCPLAPQHQDRRGGWSSTPSSGWRTGCCCWWGVPSSSHRPVSSPMRHSPLPNPFLLLQLPHRQKVPPPLAFPRVSHGERVDLQGLLLTSPWSSRDRLEGIQLDIPPDGSLQPKGLWWVRQPHRLLHPPRGPSASPRQALLQLQPPPPPQQLKVSGPQRGTNLTGSGYTPGPKPLRPNVCC